MKTTISITTFRRPKHLRHSLRTLYCQALKDCEIIVANDATPDDTEEIVASFGGAVEYLFTGQHNTERDIVSRVPGFAHNIVARRSSADILVLSNSDVYHLGDTVQAIIDAVARDPRIIATVEEVYDDDGRLIDTLDTASAADIARRIKEIKAIPEKSRVQPQADPRMPYLMGMRRAAFIAIGGHDEDFTGYACEDVDLVERLCEYGCYYVFTPGELIHMYHGARNKRWKVSQQDIQYNLQLLNERRGTVYRNTTREWGQFDG